MEDTVVPQSTENAPETPKKGAGVTIAVVVLLFLVLGIMALVNRKGSSEGNTNITAIEPFNIGDVVILNFNNDKFDTTGLAMLATDRASLLDFTSTAQTSNTAIDTLFEQNKLFAVQNGTKVRVVQFVQSTAKVRVTEGNAQGKEGWTNNAFLY